MVVKSIFVSHGSPTILVEDDPWKQLLGDLGRRISGEFRPDAVVVISPHFVSWRREFLVETQQRLPCIQDYYGFPDELYTYCYSTDNDPELARRIIEAGRDAGLAVRGDERWGLDHGAWIPLSYMFPSGVRAVPVSISAEASLVDHIEMGRAIAKSVGEERVVVLGTGSPTHRLDLMSLGARPRRSWFDELLRKTLEAGDLNSLLGLHGTREWMEAQPEGSLKPLYVAVGAAGTARARILGEEAPWAGVSMLAAEFL
ncbi:dioxygenase [Thermocladium modestius]|uniref:Dioxygenase n=1 Tax=Thermocladium modestius TaxID=62609 RepID=A0A830GUI5_9CREN|nr:class III extradiol ring-cleavage dioxygenase [Thermocladium modestius]GGP19463.1 dioxygenase [Thermocladium modestius]